MNSEILIIDKKFKQSISLYWWNGNKEKMYIYPNKWDELNDSEMNQFYPFIEELNDSSFKNILFEKADKGILFCTEDKKLKEEVKKIIPEIKKKNKNAKIAFGDYLLYDTPRTSLSDDDITFWLFNKGDTFDSVYEEFCDKYLNYQLPY